MHAVLLLVVAALAALTATRLRTVPADARVVDGDSLRVRGQSWRLVGFDAPEWDQPGGREATDLLRRLLANGRTLAVLRGRDAYGRRLASVLTPRGPLAWRLAAAGAVHGEGAVGTVLTIAARLRGVGIWSGRPVHPRIWRLARRR